MGQAPEAFGPYLIYEELGAGGMAQVHRAEVIGIEGFKRSVALKRMLRHLAEHRDMVAAFVREARLASYMRHRNIAQTYELGKVGDVYFIAMELIDGRTLRDVLRHCGQTTGPMPVPIALNILNQICDALDYAHNLTDESGQPLGIIHRDVSPSNIIVAESGCVKLIDFGIAKGSAEGIQTMSGTIKGKYGYMSPEQCKGKPLDRRSDIFALGICLYELTTLRRAFKGNDDFQTMKRIVSGDIVVPSVAVPGYPRELEAIVLTAMANDPNARFQNAQELIEALDAFTLRAKLTGTNTALGRFMTQLFGARREPWAESAPGDRTEVSEDDTDNEKTTVVAQAAGSARATVDPVTWQGDTTPLPPPVRPAARPITPTPERFPPPQSFLGNETVSEAGAQPLIDDAKLGWGTPPVGKEVEPPVLAQGGVRLGTQIREPAPRRLWLIVLVVVVLLSGAAVVAFAFDWIRLN